MQDKFLTIMLSIILVTTGIANGQDLAKLHQQIDREFVNLKSEGRPLIGISASHTKTGESRVTIPYIQSVLKAGGKPVIIPVITDVSVLRDIVKELDGLIMTGGGDFDPKYYKEKKIFNTGTIDSIRDKHDLILLKLVTDRNIPLLGICRGIQAINVGFGGTLYQDIPTQHANKSVQHRQDADRDVVTHKVTVEKGSKLASILGQSEISTNTFHHQSVKTVAPDFNVVAKTSDGIIEAIEAYPYRPILGIQWHPEEQASRDDALALKLFQHIVNEAKIFRKAKDIHKRILSVDTHSDAPMVFKNGFDIARREDNQVNLPKMEEGMLDGEYFAVYIAQGTRDDASSQRAVNTVNNIIWNVHEQVNKNKELCEIARTPADLERLKRQGKKAVFIGVENGYGIGKDISNIKKFQDMGVTYITLSHTKNNDICDSSSDNIKEWGGLSPFGQQVIREMNRLGMIIDISHTAESTVADVLALSTKPIVASHSSARALRNHDRNLTDSQMRAIAAKGGVIQVCLVASFVNTNSQNADIFDIMKHIDHVIKVVGIDHVGIGSDFDGGGGVKGVKGTNDMINITVKLIEKGYSEEDIAKIWGENFLRVMKEVQSN